MQDPMTYRIGVEVIGDEVSPVTDKMKVGEACKGFCIIYDMGGNDYRVTMHHISHMDLGVAIAGNINLYAASMIAKGLHDAYEYETHERFKEKTEHIFKQMGSLS